MANSDRILTNSLILLGLLSIISYVIAVGLSRFRPSPPCKTPVNAGFYWSYGRALVYLNATNPKLATGHGGKSGAYGCQETGKRDGAGKRPSRIRILTPFSGASRARGEFSLEKSVSRCDSWWLIYKTPACSIAPRDFLR